MRISNQQIQNAGLNGILDIQRQITDLQTQISSGRRVDTPADDPVAAAQILSIKRQLSVTGQFNQNAIAAENRLNLEEDTLRSVNTVVQRVRELAIQAGDGALGALERQGIAAEIGERLRESLGFINTRDAAGQYLFSGYQSNVPPFVAAGSSGFNYQGDSGQLTLQVGASIQVAVSDSGEAIFADVDAPLDVSATPNPANAGTGVVANQAVVNQAAVDGFFTADSATVTFSVSGGVTSYTVRRDSDNTVVDGGDPLQPLLNVPLVPGDSIVFEGLHLEFSGTPADGDSFVFDGASPQKRGLLDVIQRLEQGLNSLGDSPQDGVQLQELIADTLIGLDNARDNISLAQARIGSRLNAIEDTVNTNQDIELFSREVLSNLEDLDLAEAISNLTFQSTILQAAQGSFVQINNLSLFNFLR